MLSWQWLHMQIVEAFGGEYEDAHLQSYRWTRRRVGFVC